MFYVGIYIYRAVKWKIHTIYNTVLQYIFGESLCGNDFGRPQGIDNGSIHFATAQLHMFSLLCHDDGGAVFVDGSPRRNETSMGFYQTIEKIE
jgi:hypothetical protein